MNNLAYETSKQKIEIIYTLTATFSIIITFILPAFFIVGLGFYQGWLSTFGISTDTFPISVHETYVQFYLALVHLPIYISDAIKAGRLSDHTIITTLIILLILTIIGIWRYLNRKKPKPNKIIKNLATIPIVYGISFLITLIFIYIPTEAYNYAKNNGEQTIKTFNSKGCFSSELKLLKCGKLVDPTGKILQEGLLITLQKNLVAFYKHDKRVVITHFSNRDVIEGVVE